MPAAALCSLHSILIAVGPLGATLHVPADYPTIQACIDAAVSAVDECVVAPGTYNETIDFLGKAIGLRSSGGADVTTIDATGIGGSVITRPRGEVNGFTITGGTGTDVEGQTHGGGIYNDSHNPTVTNCTFSGNSAYAGGAMYNYRSSPTVINCTFLENTADGGAGIENNNNSSPTVTNCTFTGNTASFGGGGMLNFYYSSPTVTNCTFSGNTTNGLGGGMYNDENSSPTVTNCTFSGNQSNAGGGIYTAYSRPRLTNCTFSENTAATGGAMHNYFSNATVTNCSFSSNTASGAGYGGGMYNVRSSPTVIKCTFGGNTANFGGGMHNIEHSSPTVHNCAFSGNTTFYSGGGMHNSDSNPTVNNCTFTGNTADSRGGGMRNDDGSPMVRSCILWGNSAPTGTQIYNGFGGTPTITYSDVQAGLPAGTVDGGGNINLDPMFGRPPDPGPDGNWDGVDDDYGDLRLQADSPCINAGHPAFVPQFGETDLDGHPRVLCKRVDMGAYEFGFLSEYDCDRPVTLADFTNWGPCMLGPYNGPYGDGCGAFDSNFDLDVDLRDFAAFQNSMSGDPAPSIVLFDDPDSDFATADIRDVDDEFVRFDTSTDSIIWAATGVGYHPGTWTVDGPFLAGGVFKVRFGTKDGERRAYFTETAKGFICQIEVSGPNFTISATDVPVPQDP